MQFLLDIRMGLSWGIGNATMAAPGAG
jgi:hypothetical protein